MAVSYAIRQVGPTDAEGLAQVTALHMELLDFGPMAQFGDEFIRQICYAIPLRDSLLHIAVAVVEDQPAGFIAYTDHAHAFHSTMLHDHFVQAGWLVGLSLLQRPERLLRLPRAMKVVLSRDDLPESVEQIQAEVISYGVRRDFLAPAFVRRTGLKINLLLLKHAFAHFREAGYPHVRMIVDADNLSVRLLYQSLGADFTPCTYGGVESSAVIFDSDAPALT